MCNANNNIRANTKIAQEKDSEVTNTQVLENYDLLKQNIMKSMTCSKNAFLNTIS